MHAAPIRESHHNLQWPHRRSGQARRTNAALSAFAAEQRKAREALAWQRQREGTALADLKTERAALSAKGRRIETEAAPIRYVAELIGVDIDSEQAIRWVIALMVLCATHLLSHWGLRLRHAGESG